MQQFSWRRWVAALVLGLAALVAPAAVEAQTGRISGLVSDASTGEPIAGVQVFVRGTAAGSVTQANGRYTIVSVPPGTQTVEARRIGYQPAIISNVDVRIDVTRELNIRLTAAAGQVAAVRITAETAPLVERGLTASRGAVTTETIEALPVTSVAGVLSLQQGFFQVPQQNTDITSFSQTRQNVQSPIRIRGGRAGETLTLIDGIPINNVVFGGPSFDIANTGVAALDFQRGGFEAQYGNALSGIINIATREGGTQLAGNVEYQSTALGAAVGSDYDDLLDNGLLRGYLSGPIPGTNNRVRFAVSGQQTSGAAGVYEFDDEVTSFSRRRDPSLRPTQTLDLFPGFRAFGYDRTRDVLGKLTFYPTASGKLNLTAIAYDRQRQPFDYDYVLTGFNPLNAPAVRTNEDSIGVFGQRAFADIVQGSIRAERQLYSASYQQRFGRSNLTLRAAQLNQERTTCNYFLGVCQGAAFSDLNFTESYVAPGISSGFPTQGTDEFYGGEKIKSNVLRADIESQVTDHHNLAGGLFYQRHDIQFAELRNQGTNNVFAVPARYSGTPYEVAAYLQDRIEYDFLTVNLGARFDYAKASGRSFANPLDPSNGTTVFEVCEGRAPGVGGNTRYTFNDPVSGQQLSGYAACVADSAGAQSAVSRFAAQARGDDFEEAEARASFNPRIGLAFPLTERSNLYFNFGRYAQNPVYNNLYQNTGIGTTAGAAGGGVCAATDVKPNSTECNPTVFQTGFRSAFLGNPNLALEQTTSYEIGYAGEFLQNYGLQVSVFSKDQTGLSGVAPSRPTADVAAVYGSATPTYSVIVNQDYQTVRGLEVQLKRRIANYWGFDLNYSYSRATQNSPAPELSQQQQQQQDPVQRIEVRSEIDQPHVFNAALYLRAGARAPGIRYGNLLRNSYLTVTHSIRSGLPYTPILNFDQIGSDVALLLNSGRGPSTQSTDLLAGKDFQLANLRYGVFARVSNLFNRDNCFQVFPSTGTCDAGVVDQDRSNNGNTVGQAGATSTFFDRPQFRGTPRSIFAGARVAF